MRVAPSPVFNLLLAPQSGIVAILLFAPFLQQPMPVGGVFAGIPVVGIPVLAGCGRPRRFYSFHAIQHTVGCFPETPPCGQNPPPQRRRPIHMSTLAFILSLPFPP